MKLAALMFIFSVALCAAQKHNVSQTSGWDERSHAEGLNGTEALSGLHWDPSNGATADGENSTECSNLTMILHNWKKNLTVKDLLRRGHNPDGHVQLLSDKLMDILKGYIGMKGHLAKLRSKCKDAEVFMDNFISPALGTTKKAGGTRVRTQPRRRKVMRGRKKKKPVVLHSPASGGKKKAAGRGTQTQEKRGKVTRRYRTRKPVSRSGYSAVVKLRRRMRGPRWRLKADRPRRNSSVQTMKFSPFLFVYSYVIYRLSLP